MVMPTCSDGVNDMFPPSPVCRLSSGVNILPHSALYFSGTLLHLKPHACRCLVWYPGLTGQSHCTEGKISTPIQTSYLGIYLCSVDVAFVPVFHYFTISHSNGGLDPWSAGGVTYNISDTLIALIIPNGAHHLDLRAATADDPQDVKTVRAIEMNLIASWIKEGDQMRKGDLQGDENGG